MTLTNILFFLFGGVALVAALLAVTRRNAVASALWLVVMFFGLAGTYVVLEAFFVGAVQILVYAGAIMVLFLFVIMLLDLREEAIEGKKTPILRFIGGLSAVLFAVVSVFAVLDARENGLFEKTRSEMVERIVMDDASFELNDKGERVVDALANSEADPADRVAATEMVEVKTRLVDLELDGGAEAIAMELFTKWLLAFEVTSFLLLGAILGAVMLTKRRLT